MLPVAKIGAVVAVVGAGLTGTYFMVFRAGHMPDYSLVTSDSVKSYSSNLGKDYQHILVDTTTNNHNWWGWSFKRWQSDQKRKENKRNFSTSFGEGKIDKAFGSETNDSKALNKVCESLYKAKPSSDVTFENSPSSTDEKVKLGSDLLRYCSPLGSVPKKVSEDTPNNSYADNTIGKTKASDVISTTSKDNNGFWDAMHKYWNTSTNQPTDTYFSQFVNTENTNQPLKKSIKDICKETYDKTSNSGATPTPPTDADLKKYCSFQKITTST